MDVVNRLVVGYEVGFHCFSLIPGRICLDLSPAVIDLRPISLGPVSFVFLKPLPRVMGDPDVDRSVVLWVIRVGGVVSEELIQESSALTSLTELLGSARRFGDEWYGGPS